MTYSWYVKQKVPGNNSLIHDFIQAGLPPSVLGILYNRGYTTLPSMLEYLRPSQFDLFSPFCFADMEKIVRRLEAANRTCEKVLIYGDYDVDGVTATALLYKVLRRFGINVLVHIPKRDDGYGLHKNIIEKAAENGVGLIITVDCGITAVEEVSLASALGIDVIITDHHEPGEVLPAAYGILNPKTKDSSYPYSYLAGVGVAYKLVQALYSSLHLPNESCGTEAEYLDLVALGTIADIVALTGENRILVKYGLQVMEKTKHLGLKALLAECGLEGKRLKAGQIAFIVAPRINAAGRMDTARLALNLLLEEDNYEDALSIAKELTKENLRRQATEKKIFQEAEEILSTGPLPPVIVLSSPDWHHGVIGIVASRLVERYERPVFLISEEGDTGKGSARGIAGYHVFEELSHAEDLLLKYGGHKQAAGFTLPTANIDQLRSLLIQRYLDKGIAYQPEYRIDAVVGFPELDFQLERELAQMAPFGAENPAPLLFTGNLTVKKVQTIGKDGEHLKIIAENGRRQLEVIGFKKGKESEHLSAQQNIDILYTLEVNEYLNEKKLQAVLKDYRQSQPIAGLEEAACTADDFDQGDFDQGQFAQEQATTSISISREMLVDFYKQLKAISCHHPIFSWKPDEGRREQLEMVKILEELGIVSWLGGTGHYLLRLNTVEKTDLKNSLRFRILSKEDPLPANS